MSNDMGLPWQSEGTPEHEEILANIVQKTPVSEEQIFGEFRLKSRGHGPFREKYRPQTFDEIVPTTSKELLRNQINNPNASQIFVLEGRTGTGKTTCAKILARAFVCEADGVHDKPCLQCQNCKSLDSSGDVWELNAADKNKIDDVRELVSTMRYRPSIFNRKIYILDEVQRLTAASQQLLLTELENPPSYLTVFLCTTDIDSLDKALVDRSCKVTFKNLTPKQANSIITQVFAKEQLSATDEIKEKLFFQSNGSIRALLNNIQAYKENGFDAEFEEDTEITTDVKMLFNLIASGNWAELGPALKSYSVRKQPEKLRMDLENFTRGSLLNTTNKEEAAVYANILYRLNGSLLVGSPSTTAMYNLFVLKCFRACLLSMK